MNSCPSSQLANDQPLRVSGRLLEGEPIGQQLSFPEEPCRFCPFAAAGGGAAGTATAIAGDGRARDDEVAERREGGGGDKKRRQHTTQCGAVRCGGDDGLFGHPPILSITSLYSITVISPLSPFPTLTLLHFHPFTFDRSNQLGARIVRCLSSTTVLSTIPTPIAICLHSFTPLRSPTTPPLPFAYSISLPTPYRSTNKTAQTDRTERKNAAPNTTPHVLAITITISPHHVRAAATPLNQQYSLGLGS